MRPGKRGGTEAPKRRLTVLNCEWYRWAGEGGVPAAIPRRDVGGGRGAEKGRREGGGKEKKEWRDLATDGRGGERTGREQGKAESRSGAMRRGGARRARRGGEKRR